MKQNDCYNWSCCVIQSADKALERLKKASEDDEKSATKRLENERKEFQSEKKTWKDKHKQVRATGDSMYYSTVMVRKLLS